MNKSSDCSIKSQLTHHKDPRKGKGESREQSPKDGPEDLRFVLLCLDYLRDLRRTNEPDFLKKKKRLHPDYLSLAIFALSRSILRPDYLTNKSSPKDIFDTASSGSNSNTKEADHHEIPHISKITQEVLSPYNALRPYDESYDDLHPSNLYRFYPMNGLASGPEDGPLGLDELVLAGLRDIEGRCRLDAEREIVKSSHFEHYIQSVTARGYFYDKANSGKRKDPKEEEARKQRKIQAYKDKYRKAIAKYRQKLAQSLEGEDKHNDLREVNAELLSAPGSPKVETYGARVNRDGQRFHSPPRNGQIVGGDFNSPSKFFTPVSPLTPNTAACSSPKTNKFRATPSASSHPASKSRATPRKQRPDTQTTTGATTASREDSLINSPNKYNLKPTTVAKQQKYDQTKHKKTFSNPDSKAFSTATTFPKKNETITDNGRPQSPPTKKPPQKKVLSPRVQKVKNMYEEKLAASESSEAPETNYEGPVFPEVNSSKATTLQQEVENNRWNYPKSLSIPDITEPKPRSSPNTNKSDKTALPDEEGSLLPMMNATRKTKAPPSVLTGLKPIRSPRKSPKTSCTSPLARLRHEKKEKSAGGSEEAEADGCSTPVTSPRRSRLSDDSSWINSSTAAASSSNARKDDRKVFSFSSRALSGRLGAPKELKIDPFQLAPPKCFSHIGAARILTAQGVEWGSTTNLSSPRNLRSSPRACNSPSNAYPPPRRGVC